MTVQSTDRKAGPFFSGTILPFDFKVFSKEDIQVIWTSAAGVESILVLDSEYSVALNPDQDNTPGGSVTLNTAISGGANTVIIGDLIYDQGTDIRNQGGFEPETIEDALDRVTILVQQLLEMAKRTLRIPASSSSTISTQLPQPTAGNVLGWNGEGDQLTNLSPQDIATTVAFGTAFVDQFEGDGVETEFSLSANPALLANMDVQVGGVSLRNGIDFILLAGAVIKFTTPPAAPGVPGSPNIQIRGTVAVPQGFDTADVVVTQLPESGLWTTVQGFINRIVSGIGASIIGYTPAGTGAVATTVEDILDAQLMVDYTALRAYTGAAKTVRITGLLVTAQPQGIAGFFQFDATDTTSAENGGTVIVGADGRRWKRVYDGNVNAKWFGAIGDGTSRPLSTIFATLAAAQAVYPHATALTDELDWAAIQAALNTKTLVDLTRGKYRTNVKLVIGAEYAGFNGSGMHPDQGTVIDYFGAVKCIDLFDTSVNKRVSGALIQNMCLLVNTVGAKGIDFSHSSYGEFNNIFIRLLAANQDGVYGMGNAFMPALSSAPYYNKFDNIKIFGNNDVVSTPGQIGFHFVGDENGSAADGPNANIITNCGQITGLSTGVWVESGVGNLFSNIIMESIANYSYRFGNALKSAVGRADENMVVNHWQEGTSGCVFVRFEGDAAANSITNYSVNSISNFVWDNQSSSAENFVKAKGNFYVLDFYAENIPASATTILRPTSPAWPTISFGGVVPPFKCVPYVMQVSAQNFAVGGLGNGVVKFHRTGDLHPDLQFTVNAANRLGGKVINRTPDVSLGVNTFDGTINSQAEVVITTDASWDQINSDVHVQIVFFG